MPVLFLDFDGPLFPDRQIRHSPSMQFYPGVLGLHEWITYWQMDETSVRQLNALYDIYPFDTVVSSSWKNFVTKEQVEELFEVNELNLHLHKNWCTPEKLSSYRCNEISWWLDEYTVDGVCPAHIILDDPMSGSSLDAGNHMLFGFDKPLFINPDVGIDSDIYNIMHKIVTSWSEDYKSREFMRKKVHGGVGI